MIKSLEDMAEGFKDPETMGELEFNTRYGASIRSAVGESISPLDLVTTHRLIISSIHSELGKRYLVNQNEKELGQIWKKWHAIHKECAASVKDSPMSFDLATACPRLERCRNMKYSVPGKPIVKLAPSRKANYSQQALRNATLARTSILLALAQE